jgi:hypothetical protein
MYAPESEFDFATGNHLAHSGQAAVYVFFYAIRCPEISVTQLRSASVMLSAWHILLQRDRIRNSRYILIC